MRDDALGLPRFQLTKLFGICLRITGKLECFEAEDRGSDMMAVAAAPALRRKRDEEHVGLVAPDDADDVAEHRLAIPDPECFFGAL